MITHKIFSNVFRFASCVELCTVRRETSVLLSGGCGNPQKDDFWMHDGPVNEYLEQESDSMGCRAIGKSNESERDWRS